MSEPVILGFTVRNKVLKKDLTTPFNSMARMQEIIDRIDQHTAILG